ncbi:hypothetical protein HJFPF1_09163 [Paramyrothecium foliicola]|nr:hypothetical protein HJFPF1_09163 [Paramyrothecium foliicola]
MAPETRSRGVPPPSRVYHSTPSLHQAQLAAPRRKVVRTYGKKTTPKAESRNLRQQTLTQIDFVSSFEKDDPIELTDSDVEEFAAHDHDLDDDTDKENQKPETVTENDEEEDEEEDEAPVSSGRKRRAASVKRQEKAKSGPQSKRRRTLGDAPENKKSASGRKSRRKTLGDLPSSNYHTQTLTQLIGNEQMIQASDGEENDGFASWLGDPTSPSPRNRTSRSILKQLGTSSPVRQAGASTVEQSSPATSIIPQTPAKRLRFEIPSSSQQLTPLSSMMDRYGAPDQQVSPSKKRSTKDDIAPAEFTGKPNPRRRGTPRPKPQKMVVEDTFATESWGSATSTPTKPASSASQRIDASSSMPDLASTPTKPRARNGSAELGNQNKQQADATPEAPSLAKNASSTTGTTRFVDEIPDSEQEDDESLASDGDQSDEEGYDAGAETQLAMNQIADLEDTRTSSGDPQTRASSQQRRRSSTQHDPEDGVEVGHKSSERQSPPRSNRKRLRTPINHPISNPALTQPLESQRVALHILQDFPPATVRTDILFTIEPSLLDSILEGFQTHILLSFKAPAQAARFWLYDGSLLRFMACPGDSERTDDGWQYHLKQVYELNNPVDRDEMREDGWIDEDIGRYVYLPPAVVGQLLWNLRHAMFDNDGAIDSKDQTALSEEHQSSTEESSLPPRTKSASGGKTPDPSLSISQQIEEQIQSDIAHSTQFPTSEDARIPSTPDAEEEVPSSPTLMPPPLRSSPQAPRHRETRYNTIRPSQATTASQASTYEAPSSASKLPPHLHQDSSSNLDYQDYGESVIGQLPHSLPAPHSSQVLLSKSQMLSDSLLQDDGGPPEIWDSDEDADEQL